MAQVFSTELWTTARVAQSDRAALPVRFHRSHVARLLHELKFTCQKPQRRARWNATRRKSVAGSARNGRVLKKPRGWAPTSSLSTNPVRVTPTVWRTGAVRQIPLPHHHYVVIVFRSSAVCRSVRVETPWIVLCLHDHYVSGDEVYDFLWYLLRHLRGQVIVVWDGVSIHDPNPLAGLRRKYPRLHLLSVCPLTPRNSTPSRPLGIFPRHRSPTADPMIFVGRRLA